MCHVPLFTRWSSGTDIITYKSGGGEEDNNYMMTLTAKSVGDIQDWGSATIENGRSYAMRMDVLPSKIYSFIICFRINVCV